VNELEFEELDCDDQFDVRQFSPDMVDLPEYGDD